MKTPAPFRPDWPRVAARWQSVVWTLKTARDTAQLLTRENYGFGTFSALRSRAWPHLLFSRTSF